MSSSKYLLVLVFFVLISCTKKALPVITTRETVKPVKRQLVYPPKETVKPDTVLGKEIFVLRCGRCHGLPQPGQFNAGRWDDILPGMIERANLDNEQALHVRTYLLSLAAK